MSRLDGMLADWKQWLLGEIGEDDELERVYERGRDLARAAFRAGVEHVATPSGFTTEQWDAVIHFAETGERKR